MKRWLLFSTVLLISVSCNKITKYGTIPKITFNDMGFNTIKQGSDTTLRVTIDFEDGDGDIGFQSENLFFVDPRDSDTVRYLIPTIPERFEPKRGLKGTLQVDVLCATLVIKDTANHPENDTLIWNIYLKDQAGNQSNIIKSEALILTK
ncbi:MAG: hypothetical protein JNM95_15595 [Chitinophagaceae bacterium]|nr:hypothetical protein [Chitinophagaceae bacterium]